MCCNSKGARWSTIFISLAAAAVPTLLYVFKIIVRPFPLALAAIGLAVATLFALGYLAAFGKKHRFDGSTLLESGCQCFCDMDCVCRFSTELLIYAGLLFFAAFIAIAAVNCAFYGLVVVIVAVVSFLTFATLLTLIRLVYCYINERCD